MFWQKVLKSWVEDIPHDISKHDLDCLQEVPALKELSTSRQCGLQLGRKVQVHVFFEASEFELCVVAYLLIEVEDEVRASFVRGKTRVAPIRNTTNPKLELQATFFASRIKVSIFEKHDFTIDQVFIWSDSTTALRWLTSFDKKHQIFVANGIGKMLENTQLREGIISLAYKVRLILERVASEPKRLQQVCG